MKTRTIGKPEQKRNRGSSEHDGHGHAPTPQARAVLDSRTEMERQQGLLHLVAASPRAQFQCACGAPSAVGGRCTSCETKGNRMGRSDRREVGNVPKTIERQMRFSGQPLDAETASFFGSRYGYDFGNVRVHTDSTAAQSARELSASAFTVGQNIVFGAGRFNPQSVEGKRLLGHELAHVVQQGRSGPAPASSSDLKQLERYADQAADTALAGKSAVTVQGAAQGGVQLNAEVYVWDPHVDGYGHAAIKLTNGSYISWWPAGGGTKAQQYWTGRPGGGHSYAEDIGPGGEGKGPDHTYDLGNNCLDEAAMWTWYTTNFSGSPDPKWSVLRNSCSDVAHQAINAGSSFTNPCYLSISHSNLFWTPKDLGAYAYCQSRWCQSKANGALNATGRYLWENAKEVAGGAAVNTLKSLYWKGEIITH
jgi:hypothetical protein